MAAPERPALSKNRTGIAGRVVDLTTKAPLPGLAVTVRTTGQEDVVLGTATSGGFGEFLVAFEKLPLSGRLRLVVNGPDGNPVYDRQHDVHLTPGLPDEVNIEIRAGTRLARQRKAGEEARATVEKSDACFSQQGARADSSRELLLAQADSCRRALAKLGRDLSAERP